MYSSHENQRDIGSPSGFQAIAPWPSLPSVELVRTGAASNSYRLHQDVPADPLYLIGCSLRWHRERDTAAGWELFQFLRSTDHNARALAADVLAKTKHTRLLVRQLRRAKAKLNQMSTNHAPVLEERELKKAAQMNTPYGLEIIESCLSLQVAKGQLVLRSFSWRVKVPSRGQPLDYVSWGGIALRRGANPTRRLRTVFG